jgi:Glycosyl hydrolase catalytic core
MNVKIGFVIVGLCATLSTFIVVVVADSQSSPSMTTSEKKGVGLAESHGMGAKQIEGLNASWYYNWRDHSEITADAHFVPMIFSVKRLDSEKESKISSDYVLGFNEPDHPKQANNSVKEALAAWPTVASKATHVIGPAMAGNPVTGDWFPAFMKAKPKIDAVAVHWYKGVSSKRFIEEMKAVHAAYHKPIWITEFAPQTGASSKESPHKFSQDEVNHFIAKTIEWMESTPYVQRYAWHDSRGGSSALFNDKGELTATGRAYAAAH